MFYWFLKRILAGPILRILFRPWVRGLDNLPAEGPAIIAGNHNHFMDSIFVPLLAPRPVVYLAKKDYFTGRGIKGAVTRWFFKLNNQLPMDRGGGSGSQASLESGLKVLREGNSLGIYPEGTRSRDGMLHKGRTGVGRLADASGATVVPCTLIGTDKVQPVGARGLRPHRVTVRFSPPVDVAVTVEALSMVKMRPDPPTGSVEIRARRLSPCPILVDQTGVRLRPSCAWSTRHNALPAACGQLPLVDMAGRRIGASRLMPSFSASA